MEADTARTPAGMFPAILEFSKGRNGTAIVVAVLFGAFWKFCFVPMQKENRIDWQQQQSMLTQQAAMLVQQAAIGEGMKTTARTMERVADKLEDVSKRVGPGAFDGGGP